MGEVVVGRLRQQPARARYYPITTAGRRRLAEEETHWAALTAAVGRVLKHT